MTQSEQILSDLLETNRPKWESLGFDFLNGDCHHLACALKEVLGVGSLLAGCHYSDDKPSIPTEYYHMVYQAKDGWTWDIDGKHAIENWEETFGTDAFIWVDITDETMATWLKAHNATFTDDNVRLLVSDLRCLLDKTDFDVSLAM